MPGTTRYSATFDRTYEEDDRADPPPTANSRRSRSLSWQAHSGLDGRPYTPLGGRPPSQRSSSTDNGPSKAADYIPTRTTATTAVKAHNNPFQFVKVGTCPLYKKAEEQLKKTKEVKKQDVLKEEEEEWQTNLDSWKSRRRKMSEDVFRRQEEIKQFELEEQTAQVSQKKTKTFSEMVESRAHRGRTLSLCLLNSPLDFQVWEYENKSLKNGSSSTFTDDSEENSTVNSEDEGVSFRGRPGRPAHHSNQNNHRTNGDAHIEQNGSKLETHNGDFNQLADLATDNAQIKPKEGSYIDSGLESISSSHRAGDTPDSGSDFSQDSNSSIDCESPRTGVNILEEFSSKSLQVSHGQEFKVKLSLVDKFEELGFTFQCGKDAGHVLVSSVIEGSKAECCGIHLSDQIIKINGIDVSSKNHSEVTSIIQKGREKGEISLLLWRHIKATNGFNSDEKHVENSIKPSKTETQNAKSRSQQYEKSIESENEMYVDDFEELQKQSELLASNNKSEAACTSSQEESKGIISLSSNKASVQSLSAPKIKENISNGALEEPNKNEIRDPELNSENQKKNVIKVKRVRKKGVYALDVSTTPNQIPQEGIPINLLYPLSPVTELPSPAEETKTMSSTLSSKPTSPVSNSQNGVLPKETLKEAEVTSTSSPTKDEKFKLPSSPKKLKIKVKKDNNDKSSIDAKVSSLEDKTPPISAAVCDKTKILSLKTGEQNKSVASKVEPPVSSNKLPKTPDDETMKTSVVQKKEKPNFKENSILSAETAASVQETKSPSLKDETVVKNVTSPNKTRNLSLNIEAQTLSILSTPLVSNAKQPKTPQDDKINQSFMQKKEKAKPKDKTTKKISSCSAEILKETSNGCVSNTSTPEILTPKTESQISGFLISEKPLKVLDACAKSSETLENNDLSPKTPMVSAKTKSTNTKELSVVSDSSSSDITKKVSTILDAQTESANAMPPAAKSQQSKTPQEEKAKPSFAQKKKRSKSKDKTTEKPPSDPSQVIATASNTSTAGNTTKETEIKIEQGPGSIPVKNALNTNGTAESFKTETSAWTTRSVPDMPSAKCTASKDKISVINTNITAVKASNLNQKVGTQNQQLDKATTPILTIANQSKAPENEKSKYPLAQKKEISKPKNINSQKVNSPANQNEEVTNLNTDSLNIVFQSEPKTKNTENQSNNSKTSENNSSIKAAVDLAADIPPVEKVAEEMEKLILEQLEEEERAKELASELQAKNSVVSPEHLLIAPPRSAEPPKEKPPPPPATNEGSQKDSSLKRVNSTKRIKKEIHKRRSNFLGIDNVDESIACNEPSIPPPPALEEILKAEMELDRQSRLQIENAATERLTMEEKEIMQKEREIIESLESEEREKQLLSGSGDFENISSTSSNDIIYDERILSLKNERKRIGTECLPTEEQQQLNLLEEKQLREREEFIRKQEADKSAEPLSDSSLSVAANVPNNSKPALSSFTETKSKVSLSDSNGDGKNIIAKSSMDISENKSSESDEKAKAPEKPALPPKPLKKKEAIRKERERLRQEQEALQREREEHRRKLMLEQEELMKHPKSHAPDAPVSRLGPLPPLVPPNFPPQLTTAANATPNARDSASFPSRSHHGAPSSAAGSINAVELMGPSTVRQNRMPASRKAVQNEAWGQQKVPSVRKQNHDSLTESRYNQNHWLIQEAEMRRLAELKERHQRVTQLPCSQTHLAEDDVCSNSQRVPVIPPTHNPHLNYAVQDKMWNYGQSNLPPKKYPAPVVKESLHTIYPRETVSQQPPTKPSRVVPMERQEQMLSVSGRKRCSHCNEELGRGAAMIIESLQLYYHIHCFQCCVCQAQLGNGSCGTDVRVRNNKLHCHNCYSNDEAGLKFSQV